MAANTQSDKIQIVTVLRGVAAFVVVWYHLSNVESANGTFVQWLGSQGFLGVEAFFVISGFVIPYSLVKAAYERKNFGAFMLRRIVRIDPPYLLSIALALSIAYAAAAVPNYTGPKPDFPVKQILAHIGYVNNFLGYKQIVRVYWTLGIEFQFYLIMGTLLPTLVLCRWWVLGASLLITAAANAAATNVGINTDHLIVHWAPLFLMGISVAGFRASRISRNPLMAQLLLCAAWGWYMLDWPPVLIGTITALMIAFWPSFSLDSKFTRPLGWLGAISYSLYLIHVPIGERLMNLGSRFVHNPTLCFAIALPLTLLAAWAFNALIEEPAIRWAKKIHYRHGSPVRREPAPAWEQPAEAIVTSEESIS